MPKSRYLGEYYLILPPQPYYSPCQQDYIPDGGPVQGLRKLQALRQQRDMQQQQSPPGIVQEESQTLSHWSDLCAEVRSLPQFRV